MTWRGAWFAAVALLGAWAPPAAAQEAQPGPQIRMEEVQIRGEVERPEVFYIIPRREVRMDLGSLSRDYRPEILEPLFPDPFEHRVRRRAGTP